VAHRGPGPGHAHGGSRDRLPRVVRHRARGPPRRGGLAALQRAAHDHRRRQRRALPVGRPEHPRRGRAVPGRRQHRVQPGRGPGPRPRAARPGQHGDARPERARRL
ncbi:MAG: hypothetical protein AVDCRST_MAG48-2454, partial [uncultured Friedmanniella sp.]